MVADDCIGPKVQEQVKLMQPGQVLLLENTRFHKAEEKNDPTFAKQVTTNVHAKSKMFRRHKTAFDFICYIEVPPVQASHVEVLSRLFVKQAAHTTCFDGPGT